MLELKEEVVMKIYKCEHCGTMIEILEGTETNIKCCGEKMNEVSLKRAGIGQQKHFYYSLHQLHV